MAEEIVSLPASPEIITKSGGNLRRNSTGHPNSSNTGGKSPPNYLRASTGSCHDLCKYGHKHAKETRVRRPWHKKITSLAPDSQNEVASEASVEIKKTTFVKLTPLASVAKTPLVEPQIKKMEVASHSSKLEQSSIQASSEAKEMSLSSKSNNFSRRKPLKVNPFSLSSPLGDSTGEGSHPMSQIVNKNIGRNKDARNNEQLKSSEKRVTHLKPKPAMVKPSSSSYISRGQNGTRDSDIKIAKKGGISKMAVKKVQLPPTGSSPKPSLNRVSSSNARRFRSLKIVPPLKNQNRLGKLEVKKPDHESSREKILHAKIVPPLKNQNRLRKLEVKKPDHESSQEKILHVIKVETENENLASARNGGPIIQPSPLSSSPKASSSPRSSSLSLHLEEGQEESEYTPTEEDECISENYEAVDMEEADNLESRDKIRSAKIIASEDNDNDPMKLKFGRGKVVDLESGHIGPKKLRFRRGRVLGENAKSEVQRRRFKKRDAVDSDVVDTDTGSGKVLLRHQDVQGKKDAQGLFNNVIEETASKLAETRKSKVKALVGAFETVISLQDGKPSTTTVP